jgi:uncharacterized protein with HEPN domain
MTEILLKFLYDVKLAIDDIESYFKNVPRTYDNYQKNSLLKRAIERNLEIIGEAINRILKEDPDFPIENAKKIIGLRNQIIHGYDSISDENIWGIITVYLPKLKSEIDIIIKNSHIQS